MNENEKTGNEQITQKDMDVGHVRVEKRIILLCTF